MQVDLEPRSIWVKMQGNRTELLHVINELQKFSEDLKKETGVTANRRLYICEDDCLYILAGVLPYLFDLCSSVDGYAVDTEIEEVITESVAALRNAELLRNYQAEAVLRALAARFRRGILDIATGGGKTYIAAGLAAVGCAAGFSRWLYLVQNKELAAQSERKFKEIIPAMCDCLDCIEPELIATTYAGVSKLKSMQFDGVLVDECHGIPAKTRALAYAAVQAYYRIGMSGTALDRLSNNEMTVGLIGPILYRAELNKLSNIGALSKGTIVPIIYRNAA